MDKYKNKYRIPSARAQWWDYGWDGSYFITICTNNRRHFFGEVRNEEMLLSPLGIIADQCWRQIVDHARNIELGPHIVMPNHVHGILNLVANAKPFQFVPSLESSIDTDRHDDPDLVPMTVGRMRLRNPGKNTISTIIGGFKSAVSKDAGILGVYFGWQSRFHDHIIRNAAEYERIARYILNNPRNWQRDKFC